MSQSDSLLTSLAEKMNGQQPVLDLIKRWVGKGYWGKIITLETPQWSYHFVFTPGGVKLRKGNYPSCEARYFGKEEELLRVIRGEYSAVRGVTEGRLKLWGSLSEAATFERIVSQGYRLQ